MSGMPAERGPRPFVEPETLAVERFGNDEGLILVHGTKLALAEHYAEQLGLDFTCPDVVTSCTLKAWSRFREFALIKSSEENLYRYAEDNGLDYGQALYEVTLQGSQQGVLREITRLHSQAKALTKELRLLKRDHQL
jgi:hypothetical protein